MNPLNFDFMFFKLRWNPFYSNHVNTWHDKSNFRFDTVQWIVIIQEGGTETHPIKSKEADKLNEKIPNSLKILIGNFISAFWNVSTF